MALCPAAALAEADVVVGETSRFGFGGIDLLEGRMAVGDIRSTAVIEAVKFRAAGIPTEIQIRDCPPGVSCPATHAIQGADYLILVAEPTEFSLHDLGAALHLARDMGIPAGVIVNKDGFGNADIEGLCSRSQVPVIGRIAFLRSRAESGASARLWSEDGAFMVQMDAMLGKALRGAARGGGA